MCKDYVEKEIVLGNLFPMLWKWMHNPKFPPENNDMAYWLDTSEKIMRYRITKVKEQMIALWGSGIVIWITTGFIFRPWLNLFLTLNDKCAIFQYINLGNAFLRSKNPCSTFRWMIRICSREPFDPFSSEHAARLMKYDILFTLEWLR